MHNLTTVVLFEFIRTLKKKSFWISILAFPTIFGVIIGVMFFSNSVADQASQELSNEEFSVSILDQSSLIQPELIESLGAKTVKTKEEGVAQVKNNQVKSFIYYPEDPSQQTIEVYAVDDGLMENEKYTALAEEILRSSASTAIGSPSLINIVRGSFQTSLTTFADGQEVAGFERVIAPGLFLLLFYAIIVLLGNQMLTSTTEEKENRVIEMILTTVAARTLIVGKILALIMLGIVQILVITAPLILAYPFIGDALDLPAIDLSQLPIDPLQMTIGALLFVCSFLLFTGLLVAIGAAVPTAKEANSFFGVAIFSMFIPLYTIAAIATDPEQLIVKIFSFFPLTAPVTLMIRNAVGNLSLMESVIGIAILFVSGVIAMVVATHVFRYGSLEYNRRLSLKEIFGLS